MLKDKVVIITGASKGLGISMAQECARAGAIVVMAARSEDRLRELQTEIINDGGQAHAVRCDIARYDDLQKLVDETIAKYGRIDGLINNEGVNFVKPFLETTEADWDHVMDVDLKGSFFLTQLCARQMLKQGGGSIVQIASVHTLASLPGAARSAAAKHAPGGFCNAH